MPSASQGRHAKKKPKVPFAPGNQAAAGVNHWARKHMTQQLVSILNEQFQGYRKVVKVTGEGDAAKTVVTWEKDGKPQDITNLRKLLDNLVFNATVLNDQAAINAVFDRVEGKPVQGLSGPEGEPLEAATFIVRFRGKVPGLEGGGE